ncbi:MAG: sigma-70 family RNA polymerase sigma factor [Gemmataceae bacterium]|nr:sigma-70 family RNA polymerase sigma factor [Gemmataceae bacterium]MDW8263892.1 sigma-70 family RNA polymerase sigma factor [Gemmataceae bacterium]
MATIGESSAQLALRDPDIRLMLRVRADEPGAFAELVEHYQERLIAVLHHLMGNADEAEDLAQEVFLRVYRARKRYRPRSKFSTWLFTIANNVALTALRNRNRALPLEVRDSGTLGVEPVKKLVADPDSGPSQRMQREELAQRVQKALETLNERQRMAVILNKFEDMNYAEIGEVMGLSVMAVKSLLSRARANLRAALQDYIEVESQAQDDGVVESEQP